MLVYLIVGMAIGHAAMDMLGLRLDNYPSLGALVLEPQPYISECTLFVLSMAIDKCKNCQRVVVVRWSICSMVLVYTLCECSA